jgi:hypothetical protein
MTLAVWLARHRTFARWLVKVPGVRDWISRRVWADFLARPGVREDLAQGRSDFEEHRTYVWNLDTGLVSPDPRWPKDGPQPKPPYYMERASRA